MATPTPEQFAALPDHIKAAAFAVSTVGTVADGITPQHVMAMAAYLHALHLDKCTTTARLGQAYAAMLRGVGCFDLLTQPH